MAIFTRNSVCAPIRVEEGITGVLTPPNSTISFRDLPKEQQVGGYPSSQQLSDSTIDVATLDSEGRALLVEFPAFVLIGVYCPANTDESRDDFRISFLNILDHRVRNLVAMGKRVILTGDLNISRDVIDSAGVEEELKKQELTIDEYISTPARRMLNHLVDGGRVAGDRDEGRKEPVLVDLTREFHPNTRGMYTCWNTKKNHRPGNVGSRIDLILASKDMKEWFSTSNVQQGLHGSDHCPIFAVIKEKVEIGGIMVDIKDLMSANLYKEGVRQRDWQVQDLVPMSGKLINEFDRRRSIKEMFLKPTMSRGESSISKDENDDTKEAGGMSTSNQTSRSTSVIPSPAKSKRPSQAPSPARPSKRGKSSTAGGEATSQPKIMGFFKPRAAAATSQLDDKAEVQNYEKVSIPPNDSSTLESVKEFESLEGLNVSLNTQQFDPSEQADVIDPIVSKESWDRLLKGKRRAPTCLHNEPCIILRTKKKGENLGRSFWICSRPVGPTGEKSKILDEWRCSYYSWDSDLKREG